MLVKKMNEIIFNGCRPKPLAGYLKALGILRVLAEQKDPLAKGFWKDECFAIRTSLGQDSLENFFCTEYVPTPIVSPWNGGSGFYAGDSMDGINALLGSSLPRFNEYKKVISEIRLWPEIPSFKTVKDIADALTESITTTASAIEKRELGGLLRDLEAKVPIKEMLTLPISQVEAEIGQKGSPNQTARKDWWKAVRKARSRVTDLQRKAVKQKILPMCRARLPEACVQWLDAVCVIQESGEGIFNPILGTGGNEGRLEFSNNFMQRLADLFIQADLAKCQDLFRSSVFNTTASGLISASIGQYDPGRAGGYNQGMEVETKNFKINPWDFALALEGALLLAGAVMRRNPTEDRAFLSVPFCVRFSPVGFTSSAIDEKGRQEVWLPIWHNPAGYAEIRHLFGEGRSMLGKNLAATGIEFSRAAGTLGVDRGIDAFERYAFLQRRGKSYVALPAGRIQAHYKPKVEVLNELDSPLSEIDRFIRSFKNTPASFASARRNINESLFRCSVDPSPHHFVTLVQALGQFEQLIATRNRSKEPKIWRPLSGLSPRWIGYCDDSSVEIRLAASIASIRSTGKVGPLRSNLCEIDPSKPWRWSEGKGDRAWYGSSLAERLAGVLRRRVMDAERRSASRFPIEADLAVSCHDVMPFLWGECDEDKIESLMWGFCLIDWRKEGLPEIKNRWAKLVSEQALSRSYCVLKLLHTPRAIKGITDEV